MHLGWEKTLEKLYEYHWFEGMAKFADSLRTVMLVKFRKLV